MSFVRNFVRTPHKDARERLRLFILTILTVEFLDELVFGVREAAWPLIRDDLHLSYTQVGIILSLPPVVGHLVEPLLGILGDVWRRRALVLAGGVAFALGTLLTGLSTGFTLLLAASIISNPASGAFIGLSQATLMDAAPERREQNMARWALAGSIGNSVGPAAIGACVWSGASWRWGFVASGALMLLSVAALWRQPFATPSAAVDAHTRAALMEGLRGALRALRRRAVLRWLVLLQLGDFTYDILRGFLALYFVDVVGAGDVGAALAVAVWTWVGLAGDFALVPLLERVRGLKYLRVSTSVVMLLFPLMLLAEGFKMKLALLGLLGFANAGWYAIIKAKLYDELPNRSGTVAMSLGNVFGLVGSLAPLALGAYAERYGLGSMMWLLALGPVALLAGLLTVRDGKAGAARVTRTHRRVILPWFRTAARCDAWARGIQPKVTQTMAERLNEEAFRKQLGTKFRVRLDEIENAPKIELELDEVVTFPDISHSRGDMERFSIYLYGPGDFFLPQRIYTLEHEQLGENEIFISAVAQDGRGFRYEAVFSYFKDE